MIRAIFFDFDGTISDTRKFVSQTLVETLELENYSFDRSKLNELIGERIIPLLKKVGITKEAERVREKFYKKLSEKIKNLKLKPCVPLSPLRDLSKKYLMIVISNAEQEFVRLQAKKLDVSSCFKEIIGVERFEPKDKVMLNLFKKYKLKPLEVIYIGDRFSDIEYARKAGCYAVAIHNKYSWSSRKVILEEKPDFIVRDFKELKKVIKKIDG